MVSECFLQRIQTLKKNVFFFREGGGGGEGEGGGGGRWQGRGLV